MALFLLNGCYTVRNSDMFAVQTAVLPRERLAALSSDGALVESFSATSAPTDDAYRIRISNPRGTLIFLGGNGNELEPVIKLLRPRALEVGLDIVILNYWAPGQPQPNSQSTGESVSRLIDRVVATSAGPVCVMGHSLGAWFALEADARPDLSGVVLAAVGTTPAELTVAQAGVWRPLLWRSSEETSLRALDGVALAQRAVSATLVVTSTEDEAIPAALSTKVFAALPSTLPKRLLILHGVKHGGYLRSDEFWHAAAAYLCRAG